METKQQKNEELKSRREFFKEAAKKALPLISAIALASSPVLAKAREMEAMGCNNGCTGYCDGTCTSACSRLCNSCQSNCTGSCKWSCQVQCRDNCYTACFGYSGR